MITDSFSALSAAQSSKRRLTPKVITSKSGEFLGRTRPTMRMNQLTLVSVAAFESLPKGLQCFVRTREYEDNEWFSHPREIPPSRPPLVREIWVGARSLAAIHGEDQDDEDQDPRSSNAMALEDQAELTDLQTMLYHDAVTGMPMIEDEDTNELRPIRNGDLITVVRGSNDDLDALFLEEADDPRAQNDIGTTEGTDHKWSGRFRGNTALESSFLEDRDFKLPNSALPEGIRWKPDELTVRRLAQKASERIMERNLADGTWTEDTAPALLAFTDQCENAIKAKISDVRFNDGKLSNGYFANRNEFFAAIEECQTQAQRILSRRTKVLTTTIQDGVEVKRVRSIAKETPKAMNWTRLRYGAARGGSHLKKAAPISRSDKRRHIVITHDVNRDTFAGQANHET